MENFSEKLKTAKFGLAAAGNTINPALLILQNKGYEVGLEPIGKERHYEIWWAERDNDLFQADDALTLLGLISIWENRGDNWQTKEDEPWLLDNFLELMKGNES